MPLEYELFCRWVIKHLNKKHSNSLCVCECTCSLGAPVPPVHDSLLFVSHMNLTTAVRASQYATCNMHTRRRPVNCLCYTEPLKQNYILRIASDDLKTSLQEAEKPWWLTQPKEQHHYNLIKVNHIFSCGLISTWITNIAGQFRSQTSPSNGWLDIQ